MEHMMGEAALEQVYGALHTAVVNGRLPIRDDLALEVHNCSLSVKDLMSLLHCYPSDVPAVSKAFTLPCG